MFGSQALEVLIGVVLTMSIVSLAASTIVEMIAGWRKWRAKMLERALELLVQGKQPAAEHAGAAAGAGTTEAAPDEAPPGPRGPHRLSETTVAGVLAGHKGTFPSYMSRESFVEAVAELSTEGVPEGVAKRLRPTARRQASPSELRAALERYFDETMERLSGAYKRRTMVALFLVGLFIACVGNVSVYHVARSLWSDTTARQAVVEAAKNVEREGIEASDLESVAVTVGSLQQVGIPVGWTEEAKADWGRPRSFPLTRLGLILGWLTTGVLVTLGAPFWFDLLSRLVALRSSRKPEDPQRQEAGSTAATQPSPGTQVSRSTQPTLGAGAGGLGPPTPTDPDELIKRALGVVA